MLFSNRLPENELILKLVPVEQKPKAWDLGPGRGYKQDVKRGRLMTARMSRNGPWWLTVTLRA